MSWRSLSGSGAALLTLAACASGQAPRSADPPMDRHAYVWAGAVDSSGRDALLVLDMDTTSTTHGTVIGQVSVGRGGTMPHHIERRVHDGVLFANGWHGNTTWIFDVRDPAEPTVRGSFSRADGIAGWTHDFARLPNGNMLVALNAGPGAYAGAGGVAEVDNRGTIVRAASAVMPGVVEDTAAVPYVVHQVAGRPRALVGLTEMGMPGQTEFHDTHGVQIWDTDALRPVGMIPLPSNGSDRAHLWPSSIESTASGDVYLNTFACGLFRISGLDGDAPTAERVFTFPGGDDDHLCGVGVTIGDFWLQTVPALPGVMVVDLRDPANVREAARLVMERRAFPNVHWVSRDGSGTRVAMTGSGDWLAMARFDVTTGRLVFDERFGTRADGSPGTLIRDSAGRPMRPHGVAWGP